MPRSRLETAERTVQIKVLVTGTDKQLTQLAQAVTRVCARSGARYVIEQREPSPDEMKLFEGEHRL